MGFIARRLIPQNLQDVQILVDDTTNDYFDIVELPTTLTQGRSAFKIFGSKFLKRGVPLKMEILDSQGNTVYISPVDFIGEEIAPFLAYRFVTIEVYPPPVNREGTATLSILGEIEPEAVDFQIPAQFQNTYNVRYQQKINIDLSTVINSQPIRFYKDPTVEAVEVVKEKRINTEVTSSERIFTSTDVTNPIEGTPRADIVDIPIPKVTGSQEKEDDVIPQVSKPNKEIINVQQNLKFLAGLHAGIPPVVKKRGGRPRFASREESAMRVRIPNANLTAKMQGGTVTIPEHTKKFTAKDEEGNHYETEVTVPKFETKIANIVNDEIFEIDDVPTFEIPTITGSAGNVVFEPPSSLVSAEGANPVQVDDFTNATISMSFEDIVTTTFSSSFEKNSYVDLTIKNMRTFSGDVYRVKVHGKMQSDTSAFSQMADTVIESPELLRDTNSPSGMLRTGYFLSSGHLNAYWSASSFDSLTKAANVTASHNSSQYVDSLYLSGSNRGLNETIIAETKQDFPFTIRKGVIYTLSMLVKGETTEKVFNSEGDTRTEGKLYFHLSGSNLNTSKRLTTNTYVGAELTEPDNDKTVYLELDEEISGIQDFDRIEHTFTPRFNLDRLTNTDTVLQIRADSGEWYVSDISLRPAMDTGFSPDEYSIQLPVPTPHSRPDKLDIFVEYFDINHNAVDTLTEKLDIPILGAPLIIAGSDNLLTGSLFIGNIQDKGIEAAGATSAYMRSIGFIGFTSASIGNPTASLSAGDNTGHGGFMIWSGSVLPDAPDNYTGAGLEIHDGISGDEESYFKFRTNPSVFDVKSKTFFFGQDAAANKNYISGSNGNLEISSSGFTVTAGGNVTASNFLMQTGVITDNVSILGAVSANSLTLPATIAGGSSTPTNASASIDPRGNARFRSGSIGGFTIDTNTITATNFELNPSAKSISLGTGDDIFIVDADVGMQLGDSTFADAPFSVTVDGAVSASKGNIGGWKLAAGTISSNNLIINASGLLETSDYVSGFKGWRISAEGNGFLEVEEARIRGTLKTTVFEKETVNAVGGQLYVANSTTVTGSNDVGASDTVIQVANASGFAAREVITAKKVSATGFSTEYMQVVSVARKDSSSDTNFSGSLTVIRGYGRKSVSGSGALDAASSGSIGEQGVAGQTYGTGQVLVSTGKVGTGFIKLNANPNDQTTPYMDMVERTGSGVFDAQLKVRLGDLSGLSSALVGGSPGFGLFTDRAFLTNDVTVGSPGTEHIAIDSTSLQVKNGSNVEMELAGGTLTLGGANGSTADAVVLDGSSVSIYGNDANTGVFLTDDSVVIKGDADADKVTINNSGLTVTSNSVDTATFGSDVVLTGGSIVIQSTAGTLGHDRLQLSSGNIEIFTNNNKVVDVVDGKINLGPSANAGATLGAVIGNIHLASTGAYIYGDNTNTFAAVTSAGLEVTEDGVKKAIFGATTVIGSDGGGVTASSTDDCIRIDTNGVKIFQDSNNFVDVNSSTINVHAGSSTAAASFGTTITLRGNNSDDDRLVIDSDGIDIFEGGNLRAIIGQTTVLGSGGGTVATDSTNDCIRIDSNGVKIFQDSNNFVDINSSAIDIYAGSGTAAASFGTTITLRGNNSDDDKIAISSGGITLTENGNDRVTMSGDGVLIGQTGSGNKNVNITDSGIALRNDTEDIISISGAEIVVSGSILEKTRLFGQGQDGTVVLYGTTNDATYKTSATTIRTAPDHLGNNGSVLFTKTSTNNWRLDQDAYLYKLTLSNASSGTPNLNTNGFRLFVQHELTIQANCVIHNDASGTTAGAGGTLSAGTSGLSGGSGGGSGGGQDGGDGGTGGGSGGFVFISARTIANSGTIRSHGGTGGTGEATGS